jgi:hypothetical protein
VYSFVTDLRKCKAPVIIGFPPPSTSKYHRGRQLFYRGKEDRHGPNRRTSQSPGPMGKDAPDAGEGMEDKSEDLRDSGASETDDDDREGRHISQRRSEQRKGRLIDSSGIRRQTRSTTRANQAQVESGETPRVTTGGQKRHQPRSPSQGPPHQRQRHSRSLSTQNKSQALYTIESESDNDSLYAPSPIAADNTVQPGASSRPPSNPTVETRRTVGELEQDYAAKGHKRLTIPLKRLQKSGPGTKDRVS